MLELRRSAKVGDPEPRWALGTDRRHLAAYVGMALIAGFALGFVAAKYLAVGRLPKKPVDEPSATTPLDRGSIQPASAMLPTNEFRSVTEVIHADTVQVEGVGPVRMLGIETPDRKSPEESYGDQGKQAVAFTKDWLLGKEVRLDYDPSTAATGNKDEAGNLLAYVYTRDGTLFNAEMIKQGKAFARVTEQFKMLDDFRGFEREAMESMRGVWGPVGGAAVASASPDTGHASSTPPSRTADEPKSRKLTPLLPADLDPRSPPTGTLAPGEITVYVSSADHMYHKEGCEYLDKKKRAMGLSEAKAAGYVACGRCFASTVMKAQ
jgi:micrococcal nuclease